jgi:hypothetical protein
MAINFLNNNDSGSEARDIINAIRAVVNTISGSTNSTFSPGQSGFTGSFLGTASWAANNIYTASVSNDTITFVKADGSTFNITVTAGGGGGGGGTPGAPVNSIQYNKGGNFSGSSRFTFDDTSNKLTFSGSIYTSGSTVGGGSGHVLTYNTSSGQIFFTASSAIGGGGSGTPGGADQEIQFNKSNTSFSGSSNLKYNYTAQTLVFSGSEFSASGSIKFPSLGTSNLSYTQILTLNTSSGQLYYTSSNAVTSPQLKSGSFGVTIDGNGSTLTPGEKGYLAMPCSGTLTNWTIATDIAGTLNISLYTSSFTQFQAGSSGSLTSLQLGSSTRIASGSLNIPFTDKNIITFRVNTGVATVTRATVTINYIKS